MEPWRRDLSRRRPEGGAGAGAGAGAGQEQREVPEHLKAMRMRRGQVNTSSTCSGQTSLGSRRGQKP